MCTVYQFVLGFVVIWWPRFRMAENHSQMVGNDLFVCQIELYEENTEYEILVVPETESRKLIN